MRIRIKKRAGFGVDRIDSVSKIDDIVVKEDLLNQEAEQINIFFRGMNSSGILNLDKDEAQRLVDTVRPLLNLVKKSKRIKK